MERVDIYTLADKIAPVLESDRGWWSPSRVARRADITTADAARGLTWMDRERFIQGEGHGAHRLYRAR